MMSALLYPRRGGTGKVGKEGGDKKEYLNAKRAVYVAKSQAEANKFANLRSGKSDIFKIA